MADSVKYPSSTSTPIVPSIDPTVYESSFVTDNDTSLKEVDMDLINCESENDNDGDTGGTNVNTNGDSTHSRSNEISRVDVDNNSLLNALQTSLQAQNNTNFIALSNLITTTITGAMSQLKTELKAELKQDLKKHHSDLLTLKQNTTEQVARIDLKVSTNVSEINTRVNSLSDKVTKINEVITNSKLHKVDNLLSNNAEKSKELSLQYSDLNKRVTNCERMEKEFLETISFMNSQLDEAKKKIDDKVDEIARIKTQCETSDICQSRLATRVVDLETKTLSSDTRQRKFNLIFEGLDETPNENTKGVIVNIFNSSGGLANPTDIDIAYRLGKPSENYSCNIPQPALQGLCIKKCPQNKNLS